MSAQDLKLLQERQLDFLSDLFPTPASTSTKAKSTGNTSSTSSTSSSHSTSTTPTTSSSTSSSTTSSSSSSSSISTPTDPSPPLVVTTTAGHTITLTASQGAQTSAISSSNPPSPKGFLENRVLSGLVFGLVGLVGLIFLIVIATWIIRRKRNKKLLEEAVMFDPVIETDTMEKARPSSFEADPPYRPYPTPYMYPTTSRREVGQFQPPSAWLTPAHRHVAY